jgi:very-short-patch-repair endonuclease
MSLPEVLLWQALEQRPGGVKFRRQQAAGPYVLDFYCHEARLAIEVDGAAHGTARRFDRDAARDSYFTERGIRTLRFPASLVLDDVEAVAATIVLEAQRGTPLRPFGPPPLAGED